MNGLRRRDFVAATSAAVVSSFALPRAMAAGLQNENRFSLLLLGDTHFDRIEHHDLNWMKTDFAKSISQVEIYSRLTKDTLPNLLGAAKASLRQADPPTAFALHVGDLVQGICGNKELAKRHCLEGWEFFKRADPGVPLLMTKGNHDVTGPGSVKAYNEVLLQKTAQELGRDKLDRSSYFFKQGDSLFAVFDAYDRTAIDWLEEVVRETQFRRLFVLLHMPVVPYTARANWRVYHQQQDAERRERLVNLLGRYQAIVLCGHLHKYSLLVRRCRTGKFVQLAISSVLKDSIANREMTLSNVSDYGPELADLEPTFSPDTLDTRRQTLSDEKPFVEHFQLAHNSGYAILSVTDDDVRAEIHSGADDEKPWKTVSLTNLLA
ncbi:MAG: metallophosphoesterase [Pirellulaceae bacterium]|nr:metallophosphoesterase [Pirellulaceae bacterium]